MKAREIAAMLALIPEAEVRFITNTGATSPFGPHSLVFNAEANEWLVLLPRAAEAPAAQPQPPSTPTPP